MKKIANLLIILSFLYQLALFPGCYGPSVTPPVSDKDSWTIFTNGNEVRDLLIEGDVLWAVTSGGVVRWDTNLGTYLKYTTMDSLADNDVRAVTSDNQGNLWFGTGHGVSCYDGTDWQTFTTEDGLVNNNVTAISQDSRGNLWFGTSGHGVSRYNGTDWQTFTTKDGLVRNSVLSITLDNQGILVCQRC